MKVDHVYHDYSRRETWCYSWILSPEFSKLSSIQQNLLNWILQKYGNQKICKWYQAFTNSLFFLLPPSHTCTVSFIPFFFWCYPWYSSVLTLTKTSFSSLLEGEGYYLSMVACHWLLVGSVLTSKAIQTSLWFSHISLWMTKGGFSGLFLKESIQNKRGNWNASHQPSR